MKELLLSAAVKASMVRNRVADSVSNRFGEAERGDVVQTILIIGVFVLLAVVVFNVILRPAITGQASEVSKCIASANSQSGCANFR